MMKRRMKSSIGWIAGLGLLTLISGCNEGTPEVEQRPRGQVENITALKALDSGSASMVISVNTGMAFQQMDNFGASDAWSAQYVGNWPKDKKETMADWLFSLDTLENGQPRGIGLTAWRFNIGAGSKEQGDESQIENPWRRAECFMDASGNFQWDRQPGQQWFLQAASDRGVEQFIGFSNSPPVHLTRNGLARGSENEPLNLPLGNTDAFADFLVEVTRGVKERTGVEFTWISPFNEPQWDWNHAGQEGCHMDNTTTLAVVRSLNRALGEASDLSSRILVAEAGEWDYLYGKGDRTGQQVDLFFGSGGPFSDAGSKMESVISAHSYYTTHPASTLVQTRTSVWNKVSGYPGLRVWCTEYCPLGNADLQQLGWQEWRKDLGMQTALHVARIIHHDLVHARVSAWQWWLAISPYDYPDGLIYVSKNEKDGTYSDSKLLWTLGNFSRFIRPGSLRIQCACDQDALMVTAYRDPATREIVLVAINPTEEPLPFSLDLGGAGETSLRPYITSGATDHDLFPLEGIQTGTAYEFPARSIITFTYSP
jgi:O-glycosyl hydrolase